MATARVMDALEDKKVQMIVGGVTLTGGIYVAVKLSWFRKNPLRSFGGKTGAMAKTMVDKGIKSYFQVRGDESIKHRDPVHRPVEPES